MSKYFVRGISGGALALSAPSCVHPWWWGTGVVICLQRDANDLHMVQPSWCHCHPIISCSSKIQNGLPCRCRLTQVRLSLKKADGCNVVLYIRLFTTKVASNKEKTQNTQKTETDKRSETKQDKLSKLHTQNLIIQTIINWPSINNITYTNIIL